MNSRSPGLRPARHATKTCTFWENPTLRFTDSARAATTRTTCAEAPSSRAPAVTQACIPIMRSPRNRARRRVPGATTRIPPGDPTAAQEPVRRATRRRNPKRRSTARRHASSVTRRTISSSRHPSRPFAVTATRPRSERRLQTPATKAAPAATAAFHMSRHTPAELARRVTPNNTVR